MFTTSWCGYCRNLKRMMDQKGVKYTEVNIEEVEGTAQIVESFNGGNQTVPTLVFSDAAQPPIRASKRSWNAPNGVGD